MHNIRTSHLRKLPRTFYLQPTLQVAKQLIGKVLMRRTAGVLLMGIIVEVEAYLGEKDPASHAYRGMTQRNEVMFGQGGHLYVYFTYGMHFCCNVVTEKKGTGHAVLLRAAEPLRGMETMARNRNITLNSEKDTQTLCNGPAKLCQAFGIRREENGTTLCGDAIWIAGETTPHRVPRVKRSTRVGITSGRERRWRFFDNNSLFVSPGKPS